MPENDQRQRRIWDPWKDVLAQVVSWILAVPVSLLFLYALFTGIFDVALFLVVMMWTVAPLAVLLNYLFQRTPPKRPGPEGETPRSENTEPPNR